MTQVIPFVIHQTWKNKNVPEGMKHAINSWKNLNLDYQHKFYDDEEIANYIKNFKCDEFNFDNNKLQTAFNKIKSGAGKADIFRYLVMYNVGGVYADVDTVCLQSITQYINPQDCTFISGNDYHRSIHQWLFMCTPKHPFMKETLENTIRCVISETPIPVFKNPTINEFDYRRNNVERYTGPFVMDYSIKKLMKMSLQNNYKREKQIVKIQNAMYKVHFHKDHFEKEFVNFHYPNYKKELSESNVKYWMDEPLFN